jgi:hypothetical protein
MVGEDEEEVEESRVEGIIHGMHPSPESRLLQQQLSSSLLLLRVDLSRFTHLFFPSFFTFLHAQEENT